jgi:branched-chain amino acid transport system ATP-binding protein
MLQAQNLESGYGPMQVLWGPTLEVRKGSITALLGPNGAGKSTMLRTILGTVRPWAGRVTYEGKDVTYLVPHTKVGMAMVLVPEGRHLFANMSVQENLFMGAYQKSAQAVMKESLELVYSLFPRLKERSHQQAGTMSGGEQQMLTIARGLMARPRLMMLDEPSQGLAPKVANEVFVAIEKLRKEIGLTILLVEQNVEYSLSVSDYAYIMHEGRIKASGSAQEIKESEVREVYLGI